MMTIYSVIGCDIELKDELNVKPDQATIAI